MHLPQLGMPLWESYCESDHVTHSLHYKSCCDCLPTNCCCCCSAVDHWRQHIASLGTAVHPLPSLNTTAIILVMPQWGGAEVCKVLWRKVCWMLDWICTKVHCSVVNTGYSSVLLRHDVSVIGTRDCWTSSTLHMCIWCYVSQLEGILWHVVATMVISAGYWCNVSTTGNSYVYTDTENVLTTKSAKSAAQEREMNM